ncbi:hypothetical protein BAE44_0005492 [Dichanthelium oligosanthes]|uniref:F-box domain-containing protein n=1 Tax=Dichanthelium oligosanthes TaxID=888268 RepID=A0A1E5W8C2_9POAL|nr:hypothetical protein BAE44_0005492 [Dichanthelium oligosanthes]
MASPPPPIIGNKAPAPPIVDHQTPPPPPPPPLPTLTDDLLEEIFLRLPTPVDLACASTACPSFHRIITDRSFLRRFRALHPPPLLGFITDGFHAAEAPHPSTPLARALAHAADFSYSFVPAGRWLAPWHLRDVRQGRVLLECFPEDPLHKDMFGDVGFPGNLALAVCDPLYRRYMLLPRIPDELKPQDEGLIGFGLKLAPTREDEEETSFRVICTGMEFSIINYVLPRYVLPDSCKPHIVLDTEGSPELFFSRDYIKVGVAGLFRITKQNDGEPYDKWRLENIVPLPLTGWSTMCLALGVAEGFLFLHGIPMYRKSGCSSDNECMDSGYFSLDVKTSELQKVCGAEQYLFRVHSYFGFPPSLSKPCL